MTQEEITRLVELSEARALDAWFRALPADTAEEWGVRVEAIGSSTAVRVARFPMPLLNRVVGLGIGEPATEAMVDALVELYRTANVPFAIQVSPAARPAKLAEWLEARGIRRGRSWAKFYRDVEPPPDIPTSLRIEQIGLEQAVAYAQTFLAGFEMPVEMEPMVTGAIGRTGWHHYLAYAGDVPVSAAALYVAGDVGCLIGAATLPDYRRRGGQGALMARRIRDAAALGCRWLVTETGEDTAENPNPSYHNMVRTGFKLAYLRPNYPYQPKA
jgi:GNAT superfamily N-acetyltransferase